jgi:3-dehydroquinate synthase
VTTVFVTGCMGAGKSSVGKALASKLGRAFIDLDEEVALHTGMRPGEIIERRGEERFREIEGEVLRRLALADGRVVALGGGTLERRENLELVQRTGKLVYLEAPAEQLAARLNTEEMASRPLLRGDPVARLRELLTRREPTYRRADLIVPTAGHSVEEVALELARPLVEAPPPERPCERVEVALDAASYPIFVTSGQRWLLGRLVAERLGTGRAALVVDGGIDSRYGPETLSSLRRSGFDVTQCMVPPGEGSKSLAELGRLYDALLGAGLDRHTPIVVLGGGVVGDLAGFAAATLFRGVPLVQVPTTLTAQVDSSLGGKVAINHPLGKNLIGSFHQPSLVFIDTSYLSSLAPRDLRAGLAEVVKYGVVADPPFFAALERDAERLGGGDQEVLRAAVRRSCEIKAQVVAVDLQDTSGARAVLNFGHTIGHALERLAGYGQLRHGEAVALGMVVAARLSLRLGLCGPEPPRRIQGLLERLGLPVTPTFAPESLVEAALADKKARAGVLHLILVEELGRVRQVPLSPKELVEHLRGLP